MLVVANFTPVPRESYKVGVPFAGRWSEVINSDADTYAGSNIIRKTRVGKRLAIRRKRNEGPRIIRRRV